MLHSKSLSANVKSQMVEFIWDRSKIVNPSMDKQARDGLYKPCGVITVSEKCDDTFMSIRSYSLISNQIGEMRKLLMLDQDNKEPLVITMYPTEKIKTTPKTIVINVMAFLAKVKTNETETADLIPDIEDASDDSIDIMSGFPLKYTIDKKSFVFTDEGCILLDMENADSVIAAFNTPLNGDKFYLEPLTRLAKKLGGIYSIIYSVGTNQKTPISFASWNGVSIKVCDVSYRYSDQAMQDVVPNEHSAPQALLSKAVPYINDGDKKICVFSEIYTFFSTNIFEALAEKGDCLSDLFFRRIIKHKEYYNKASYKQKYCGS